MSRQLARQIQSTASQTPQEWTSSAAQPQMVTQQMAAPQQSRGLFASYRPQASFASPSAPALSFQRSAMAPAMPTTPDLGGWGGTGGGAPGVALSQGGVYDDGRAWIQVADQGNDKGGLLVAPEVARHDLSQGPEWVQNNYAGLANRERDLVAAGASPDYARYVAQKEMAETLDGWKAAGVSGIG